MSPTEITRIAGSIMGVSVDAIRQKTRKRRTDRIVFARFAAISLCKAKTDATLTSIASYFGLKNHATVINAYKSCENMRATNRVYRELYGIIERNLSKSDLERLQLTEFIPFVYTLENPGDEQNN